MHLTFRNVNDAFDYYAKLFTETAESLYQTWGPQSGLLQTKPSRAGNVIQLTQPVITTYTHPTERVLFNAARDANPFFHLYEALWMLVGRNDVASLKYYNRNIGTIASDDGITFNGAYGYRWRLADAGNGGVVDQLELIMNQLACNVNCRRAVLQMWNVKDDLIKAAGHRTCPVCRGTKRGCKMSGSFEAKDYSYACPACQGTGVQPASKDVCCNTSIYFSLHSEAGSDVLPPELLLNMTVSNRSNDMVWGMLGANYVHFSFLQEYLAAGIQARLKAHASYRGVVRPGQYHHMTNNLHVYEDKLNPKWLRSLWWNAEYHGPPTPLVKDFYQFDEELRRLVRLFPRIIKQDEQGLWPTEFAEPWIVTVALSMLMAYEAWKCKQPELALERISQVASPDWRKAGTEWLKRRI